MNLSANEQIQHLGNLEPIQNELDDHEQPSLETKASSARLWKEKERKNEASLTKEKQRRMKSELCKAKREKTKHKEETREVKN